MSVSRTVPDVIEEHVALGWNPSTACTSKGANAAERGKPADVPLH
jgi:hypothetical protein